MKIIYDTDKKGLTPDREDNLLELCLNNKIELCHSCEGMASCGTCRVIITSDPSLLPERNSLEQDMASDRGFKDNERLACQLPLNTNFRFKLP